MSIVSGVSDFFGLDIGSDNVCLVQLSGSSQIKNLVKYAYTPIDTKIAISDSKNDQLKLTQTIKELIETAHVSSRNVAVGIPTQKVFTALTDFDKLPQAELAKTIHLQADSLIPSPLSESKIDWAVLGDAPSGPSKVEVLLSSVPNAFIEARLDMLEAIGLNVIAFEPDSMALARSTLALDVKEPQMVLDIGRLSTNLVIVMDGAPRLTRSIPTGSDAIIRAAMQALSIDEKQAQQFVFKFGLSKDKLEGQIYQAIIGTVDLLMVDIEKSIKFFLARYPERKIEHIVVTGAASTLPELPLFIANKFAVNVEIGNAWRNVTFPSDRQNELLAISNYFSVAVGLAERIE